MRRTFTAVVGFSAMLAIGGVPASAIHRSVDAVFTVADAQALSFTLRPSYDAGSGSPLHLYVGYADANLVTPEPAADGQASWYNFNIIETAAFKPADRCLPRNDPDSDADGTPDAVEDVQAYLSTYIEQAAERLSNGSAPPPPTIPGVRGFCSERFPGFAQSRFPPTITIGEAATDNYFDKPTAASACRDDPSSPRCDAYNQHWPTFSSTGRRFVRDGAFRATAAGVPRQESVTLLMGAGDGEVVSIGLARNTSRAFLVEEPKRGLTVEATSSLDDVCVGVTASGCTLRIDSIQQVARVTIDGTGKPQKDAYTVITGVHGVAGDRVIKASDLRLEQASIDLGGYFQIQGVSKTHGCDTGNEGDVVADAGGFRIGGTGGPGQAGGGIMVGGACARARLETFSTPMPVLHGGDSVGTPDRTISFPGSPGQVAAPRAGGSPPLGAPRIVTRTVTRPTYMRAIAWRTAPWWGSILGLLLVFAILLYVFRRAPIAAPAIRGLDRFARQFLKG